MKKLTDYNLQIFAGILFLFSGILLVFGGSDMKIIGYASLVIGLALIVSSEHMKDKNKKEYEFAMTDIEKQQGEYLADEGGEILTDKEEKQVWEDFQGKIEEDDN